MSSQRGGVLIPASDCSSLFSAAVCGFCLTGQQCLSVVYSLQVFSLRDSSALPVNEATSSSYPQTYQTCSTKSTEKTVPTQQEPQTQILCWYCSGKNQEQQTLNTTSQSMCFKNTFIHMSDHWSRHGTWPELTLTPTAHFLLITQLPQAAHMNVSCVELLSFRFDQRLPFDRVYWQQNWARMKFRFPVCDVKEAKRWILTEISNQKTRKEQRTWQALGM